MRQTDYGYSMPLGLAGGIYDLSDKDIVTRSLDEGVETNPGMALMIGTDAGRTVKAPATGDTKVKFEGVFVHGSKNLEEDKAGKAFASGFDTVGVMKKGRIWAAVASTATTDYGTAAAVILSGDNAGMFTSSADAAETSKVAIDAKFVGKSDTGIAVIEL